MIESISGKRNILFHKFIFGRRKNSTLFQELNKFVKRYLFIFMKTPEV
ncbi:hypothetical protein FEDK69T_02190 [Flavobacterium enshiense DK69]|nr:hypothetical protein FEDK69T_02190 [Flavobacterium enshiense DK69]